MCARRPSPWWMARAMGLTLPRSVRVHAACYGGRSRANAPCVQMHGVRPPRAVLPAPRRAPRTCRIKRWADQPPVRHATSGARAALRGWGRRTATVESEEMRWPLLSSAQRGVRAPTGYTRLVATQWPPRDAAAALLTRCTHAAALVQSGARILASPSLAVLLKREPRIDTSGQFSITHSRLVIRSQSPELRHTHTATCSRGTDTPHAHAEPRERSPRLRAAAAMRAACSPSATRALLQQRPGVAAARLAAAAVVPRSNSISASRR